MSAKNGPFAALMLTTLWTSTVWAGDLNAPAAPTDPGSAMYGLDDVYNRLDTGEAGAKRTGAFTEPVSGPGSTGRTLDEVMGKAPVADVVNGVSPSGVLAGESYWSLLPGTDWGTKSGTMPNNGTTNYTPTITDQPIAEGYHSGSGVVIGDADLTEGNIASGVDIFGVTGTAKVATGDAVSGDVLTGKTFSNTIATGVLGSMPVKDGDNASTAQSAVAGVNKFTAPTGFYDGNDTVTATDAQVVALDSNIATANIKSGITIFGVAGDSNVVNTSSGDAVAGDIRIGKKAWVDGSEVTGILAPAAVERTGQNTSVPFLLPTPSSDGDLQKGVIWPNPRFTNNSDGTVTDNLTGLVWLTKANCIGTDNATFDTDGIVGDGKVSWQNALGFVAGLNDSTYDCGDTSNGGIWRLPNRRELESLLAIAYQNPALPDTVGTGKHSNTDPFSDVQNDSYWSSSTFAGENDDAWIVFFTNGIIEYQPKADPHFVWPVRAGQ